MKDQARRQRPRRKIGAKPLAPISKRDIHKYAGRWVAVRGSKVAAAADTLEELFDRVDEHGIDEVILVRIPAKGEPDILIY